MGIGWPTGSSGFPLISAVALGDGWETINRGATFWSHSTSLHGINLTGCGYGCSSFDMNLRRYGSRTASLFQWSRINPHECFATQGSELIVHLGFLTQSAASWALLPTLLQFHFNQVESPKEMLLCKYLSTIAIQCLVLCRFHFRSERGCVIIQTRRG